VATFTCTLRVRPRSESVPASVTVTVIVVKSNLAVSTHDDIRSTCAIRTGPNENQKVILGLFCVTHLIFLPLSCLPPCPRVYTGFPLFCFYPIILLFFFGLIYLFLSHLPSWEIRACHNLFATGSRSRHTHLVDSRF
jgi:hypothetical protein